MRKGVFFALVVGVGSLAVLGVLAQPQNFRVVRETATSVTIAWVAPSDDIIGYEIRRAPDQGQGLAGDPSFVRTVTDSLTATVFTDLALNSGTNYFYQVRGYKAGYTGSEDTLRTDFAPGQQTFLQATTKASVAEPRIENAIIAPGKATSATISYDLLTTGQVEVTVYTVDGVKVNTLVNSQQAAGQLHSVTWDATNETGGRVGSGTYLVHVKTPDQSVIKKIVVVR